MKTWQWLVLLALVFILGYGLGKRQRLPWWATPAPSKAPVSDLRRV